MDSLPPLITAIAALILAIGTAAGVILSALNMRTIRRVETHTNGMMKELRAVSKAAGFKEGRARRASERKRL